MDSLAWRQPGEWLHARGAAELDIQSPCGSERWLMGGLVSRGSLASGSTLSQPSSASAASGIWEKASA